MFRAFGRPVVPDEKRRAAVVSSLVFWEVKRSQSASPWVWSQVQDLRLCGIGALGAWMSKTKMFERGIEVSLQAEMTFFNSSGSLMKNLMSAVWMAWSSS